VPRKRAPAPAEGEALLYALAAQARRRRRAPRPRTQAGMGAQPPAASPTQHAGDAAQALALRHLEAAGLVFLAANQRSRTGEIDLIVRDDDTLVFVEVRSRQSARFGGAAASVGHDKQRRLWRTAQVFLQTRWRGPLPPCRFDVVAIDDGVLTWLRDVFRES